MVAAEDSVRVGTVTSGQAHIARQIEAPDNPQFAADGLSLHAASTNGVNNGLSFRFRDPAPDDLRTRQALIAAIDRQAIVDTLFTDNYPLATGALAATALGYVDTSEHYVHDPEKAASLLDFYRLEVDPEPLHLLTDALGLGDGVARIDEGPQSRFLLRLRTPDGRVVEL